VSRRAKGVSIGINLNPNNACNWRCVYCQVEGLKRGSAPELDLLLLEDELRTLLEGVKEGDFLEQHVPVESRRLSDVALSGNGEPTSSPQFLQVIEMLAQLRGEGVIPSELPITLITNGSLADRVDVQAAVKRLAENRGRVWFKLDAGSDEGLRDVNSASTRIQRQLARLELMSRLCPTSVQSCWFKRKGCDPDPQEVDRYVENLTELQRKGVPLLGVQLYTLARESHQPEAPELAPVSPLWLDTLAQRLTRIGLTVQTAY
jgi:wyosine [tRNA(Phe)-imidazoG37] synthetase (radical SAM superfamily)